MNDEISFFNVSLIDLNHIRPQSKNKSVYKGNKKFPKLYIINFP